MKKILTLALALIMMLSLAVCVSAAGEVTGNAGSHSGTINVGVATYTETYYVNVSWDSLTFTYSGTTWNPETHQYEGTDAKWTNASGKTEATITVVNRSNVAITATATVSGTTVNGVTAAIVDGTAQIMSAENVDPADLTDLTETLTLKVSGNPTVNNAFDVDTVTVTIEKFQ